MVAPKVPGAQSVQAQLPVEPEKRPAGQGMQSVALLEPVFALNEPAAQAVARRPSSQ
ncbi:MAG: hypothetical protein R3E53_03920 [Myxococcota bacterium]